MLHKNLGMSAGVASHTADTSKPDVIIIDSDDKRKHIDNQERLQASGGKQPLDSVASTMLRRLASAGNGKIHSSIGIKHVGRNVSQLNKILCATLSKKVKSAPNRNCTSQKAHQAGAYLRFLYYGATMSICTPRG